MIQEEIEKKIRNMDKRKLLFLFGEHMSGKTREVIDFLKRKYGDEYSKHYIDVGLYLQQKILEGPISTYEIYPEEFSEDVQVFFEELINEKFIDSSNNLYVLDHLEFLLSEKNSDWIKVLDRVTLKKYTVIVVVPNEYRHMLPVKAYDYVEVV
ncbi:atpase AAA [Thermoanaerobacterium thermosaccharolyticum]|uniref:Atpase AAA n=1 Tax=Thermoanaerobacterium thermosaccharolyticum TaxID=1517 RepID=A0A223HZW9_THETR|nr:hypothetical protein [Thermoanaerobacterium thermosaccharolyticum]AST58022.1 atpase AAA [Thermoanaerobacterium thermosaccharolyticum]